MPKAHSCRQEWAFFNLHTAKLVIIRVISCTFAGKGKIVRKERNNFAQCFEDLCAGEELIMDYLLKLSEGNQTKAWELIRQLDIVDIWKSVGAEVHLVGSLKMGLLMKHKDIDFHIYSSPLLLSDSFTAMAKLAENPSVKRVTYANLLHTEESCIEWHAWCDGEDGEEWQVDMIHLVKGSRYDGYFEGMANRVLEMLTAETKQAILRLKYETPESEKVMGVEYYSAVLQDGVRTYPEFVEWRKRHPQNGIILL